MAEFGEVSTNTVLSRQFILPVENLRMGLTAPSQNLRGTTPSVPALTFANVNELASTGLTMPLDWDQGTFNLILEWALNTGEVNNDTLDVTVNYILWESVGGNNSILKTSTSLTPQITVTTANGLASGDVYRMSMTMLSGDANNPTGNASGFSFEVSLTNTTGVGTADLISVCISYTASY